MRARVECQTPAEALDMSPTLAALPDEIAQVNSLGPAAPHHFLGHSARIAISDVALGKASLDEVRAVTGHEIGHYVLGHIWRMIFVFAGLAILHGTGCPILFGASRKRMIGELSGCALEDRDLPSVVAAIAAAERGAAVLRVHDAAALRAALKVWEALGPHGAAAQKN